MDKPTNKLIDGILLVNKQRGMTSTNVINIIKKTFGRKNKIKVGHGGTLDPEAQGLLVLGFGKYTKKLNSCIHDDKIYKTTINLSYFTTTDDVSGEKEEVKIEKIPTYDDVLGSVNKMIGTIEQIPSKFSAIKINGKRAYELARKGKEFEMKSRTVNIHDINIDSYDYPYLTLTVRCSKGTYIRTLGKDIGLSLGTGGHLTELIRLKSGSYSLDDSVNLDDIIKQIKEGAINKILLK